ncbi:MAG: hypothetical protein NXY57DRAFT_618163 [Lentinula lateritia]|nr:MAG: hypothetical protein NXY57DRAFT_618163 [Lentinula lateritia]
MSSGVDVDIPKTFGALLIGAVFASFLSGGITVQTLVYFKLYPSDGSNVKTLVIALWLLDACHTALIWSSQWEYFIRLYGKAEKIDYISTTLANLSIEQTEMVSCSSSGRHRYLETCFSDGYNGYYFREHVRWLFTLGLALSSAVDVLITSSLFMLLRRSKMEGGSLDGVIDTLILYTFETGSVTCAATIVSMICWISIPTQLIFMALHFIIGKCE